MCGIVGIVNIDGRNVDKNLLLKMTASLKHRGPDGHGVYIAKNIGLGHTRLKIIDLSEKGNQPISNEDKTIWITVNGEVYNYKSIRDQLEKKGHRIKSDTDIEVIVHSYEEWGINCINKFNGMFALALFDLNNKKLFLVRDRLGIKPLFYFVDDKKLIFASEIKAILVDETIKREIDMKCLHNYLSLNYVTAPVTLFSNIYQLLPGHFLEIDGNRITENKFWNVSFVENKGLKRKDNEWQEEFNELLFQSVERRLMSDVPFGAFLSGGIDSSSIVYFMKQILHDKVKTFSIGFEEKTYNELDDANHVSNWLSTDHYFEIVKPQLDESFIKKIIWHSEEPTADPSIIPMFYLSKMARRNVTMALSGDGADEILAGYETYQAYYLRKLYRFLPAFFRKKVLMRIVESLPTSMTKVSVDYKLKRFVKGAELPWEDAHYYWRIIFDEETKRCLYSKDFKNFLGNYSTFDFIRPYFENAKGSPLNKMLEVDTKFYLPNDMLVKVDRASMAHSLEVRVPFLDHQLVEFVSSMPEKLKLRYFLKKKFALKKIMHNRLPKEVLKKKKLGFNVPINLWIQRPLREFILDTLSVQALNRIGILEPKTVSWIINQHLSGKRDFGYQIWSVLIFVVWWNMFIGSDHF